jgi:hypothetical protein
MKTLAKVGTRGGLLFVLALGAHTGFAQTTPTPIRVSCIVSGVSASSVPAFGTFTINGSNLFDGCTPALKSASGTTFGPIGVSTSPTQIVARVEADTPAGAYTLTVTPNGGTVPTFRSAFTVTPPPAPTLSSVNPGAAYVADGVAASTNLFPMRGQQYATITAGTTTVRAPLQITADGRATFSVPDLYGSLMPDPAARLSALPMLLRVQRGSDLSPAVPFTVKPLILLWYNTSTASVGDQVQIRGAFSPADARVVIEYLPGQFTAPIPIATAPNPMSGLPNITWFTVPDVLSGKPLPTQTAIQAYDGHVWLQRGSTAGNKLYFGIRPKSVTTAPSSSPPACAQNRPGYTYRGRPECQSPGDGTIPQLVPSGSWCDFTCCMSSTGEDGAPPCGKNQHAYPPDCSNFCTAGGACNAQLMPGGCYTPIAPPP